MFMYYQDYYFIIVALGAVTVLLRIHWISQN